MRIKAILVVQNKKRVVIKREKFEVFISENDIINYFEYVATPYDLRYTCSHIYDTELIKLWLQRIAIYNTTILDIKNGKILKCEISNSDIDYAVSVIKKLAYKREVLIQKN